MRKYQPIWELLKQHKVCAVSAHPMHHRRIVKAVIKEKYQDVGDKFHKGEYWKRARLSHTIEGAKITFTLSISIGVDDV